MPPVLTYAGNPIPEQLEPKLFLTEPPPGQSWDSVWPKPFPDPLPPEDFSGMVVYDEFIYEEFPPDDHWPRLKLRMQPKRATETDAQYEIYRRDQETSTHVYGMYLGLCQLLCTFLGNHKTCALGACRRNGECCGRRDNDTTRITLMIYPPCIPSDAELMGSYRAEINREIHRVDKELEPERERLRRAAQP